MVATKCEVGSLSSDPCGQTAIAIALVWGNYYGAADVRVCRDHARSAKDDGATVEPLDCPTCDGSGRIAPNGEGLYVFLASTAARIDGFERAIARATELHARYVAETDANDYRARLCDQEIAAYHRSAEFHEAIVESLRMGKAATCVRCHGCGGPEIVKTCGCGRHHTAEEWLALTHRGEMDNGEDLGRMLELRDCECGSTIALPAESSRRAA